MTNAVRMTMDMDTIKTIAEASGRAVADEVTKTLREEIKVYVREALAEHEQREEQRINSYFGHRSSEEHLVQHDRIDRFLKLMDSMGNNFLGTVIRNLLTGVMVLIVLGWLAYSKHKGLN